jgi:hypothetical protein
MTSIALEGYVGVLINHIINMAIPKMMSDLSAGMVTMGSARGHCQCTCQGDGLGRQAQPALRDAGGAHTLRGIVNWR